MTRTTPLYRILEFLPIIIKYEVITKSIYDRTTVCKHFEHRIFKIEKKRKNNFFSNLPGLLLKTLNHNNTVDKTLRK